MPALIGPVLFEGNGKINMAEIKDPRQSTAHAIYEHYERSASSGFRPHLGASLIGHHCSRYLWLSFRFAKRASFPGRILRLFDTGHREESRIVSDLRAIGCEVHEVDPQTGRQFMFSSLGGHFGGSMDAAVKGLPEAPNKWNVAEFKTHNQKSFDHLQKNGVEKSKPQHYAQMVVYMGLTGMDRAIYIAVNKNTDEIYTERIKYDNKAFESLLSRAEKIIFGEAPPERISEDPAWYQCRWCDFYDLCHQDAAPLPNCRTCVHSKPQLSGGWTCERHSLKLSTADQENGCDSHRFKPVLLEQFAEPIDGSSEDNWAKYRHRETGNVFTNGAPPDGFTSAEIHAASDKKALRDDDEHMQKLRRDMGAEVVG